jgi:hypothetical protein
MYNALVDDVVDSYGVQGGVLAAAADVQGNMLAGAAAAGVEYMTNRVGHMGAGVRNAVSRR